MTPGRIAAAALAFLSFATSAHTQAVAPPQDDAATLRERLQPEMAPPDRQFPKDVKILDAWLAEGDDLRLVERLRKTAKANELVLDMNWEQSRIFDGAGLAVVLAYVNTLWRVAAELPEDDAKGLKESAAVYTLYALNIVTLDGTKCEDDSAPPNRFGQVVEQQRAVLDYLKSLSRADRMTIGTIALATEKATSEERGGDALICGGGLAQLRHDQANPGTAYKPAFIDKALWPTAQEKLRAGMAAQLTEFLSLPADDTPGGSAP